MFLFLSTFGNLWLGITRSLLLTLYLFTFINCCYSWSLPGNLSSSTHSLNRTIDFNRKQAILTRSGFTQILYNYIDSDVDQLHINQVTSKCIDSLINLNRSLENGSPWAFKMLDASGRAPIDLTGFGYVDMGNFDQCLQIDWINFSGYKEVGQHCLTSVVPNPPNPGTAADLFTSSKILLDYDEGYSLRIGFCIPSSCSQTDLKIILNKALEPYSWSVLRVDTCQISKSFSEKFWAAPSSQKISFLLLSAFVSLVAYATWKDISTHGHHDNNSEKKSKQQSIDNSDTNQWIHSFSIVNNWKKLIEPDKEMIKCPTLSKFTLTQHFVVLHFHAVVWPMMTNAVTLYAIGNPFVRYRDSQLIRNLFGEWFMDGLFAYAGFNKSLELWKKITPKTPIWRIFSIIFWKMLILNSLFCIMIMAEIVTPLFSYGPFASLIAERKAEVCSRTYLANLLFYQNYLGNIDKVCNAHSWSVAAEYQLIFFLAGLVWLFKRSPRLALTLNMMVCFGGLAYVARVFYMNDLSPHPLARGFHPSILAKWAELVYLPSEMHLWLYLSTPMIVYVIMNPSLFKFTKFFDDNSSKVKRSLYFYGIAMIFYPYIWSSSLSSYESRLFASIYVVIYRLLTGLFYFVLVLGHADEFRQYFGTESSKSSEITNNNNNNNSTPCNEDTLHSNGIIKSTETTQKVNQSQPTNNCEKYKLEPSQYKIIHIATVIFKSTYCIHIPVLIWYYSQHKWPVLTTQEWICHLFLTVFLSIASGFVFYLFILGPFNNLVDLIKPKQRMNNERLKKE